MKTDIYTKIILTVIAICLAFNVLRDINLVPNAYAGDPVVAPRTTNLPSVLKTNEDGSINVRLTSADVVEVKPAYGATFKVEPTSSATFEVKPKYSATFTVEPTSSAKFKIEADQYNPLYVTSGTYKALQVKPYTDAVFKVEQVGGSSIYNEEAPMMVSTYAYPSPARDKVVIVYSTLSQNEYITISSIDGKVMDHIVLDPSESELNIDLSRYISGTYVYNFNGNGGKFVVKK